VLARRARLQRFAPPALARALRALPGLSRFAGGRRLASALAKVDWTILDFVLHEKSFFSFAEQASLLSDDVLAQLDLEREALYLREKLALRDDAMSFGNLYRFMLLQQLPDYMLTKVDRASMGHSVEVRVPYVDHELFELLCRAPASERFDPAVPKPILKRVLARHLPGELLHRRKQGFAVHLERFLNQAFWDHLRALLHEGGAAELIRVPAVEALVAALRSGGLDANERVRTMYRIWTVAILLHWRRHVLEG